MLTKTSNRKSPFFAQRSPLIMNIIIRELEGGLTIGSEEWKERKGVLMLVVVFCMFDMAVHIVIVRLNDALVSRETFLEFLWLCFLLKLQDWFSKLTIVLIVCKL